MSIKKLKQKVATALVVAMTATNVLSAFAADTVIGKPDKKDLVTVTFDAKGGYWETASKSAASYSDAKTSTEAPVATYSQISRTFDMKGKGFNPEEFNDGEAANGNYFVNLKNAGAWFAELDYADGYKDLKHSDDEMKFAGWYYNPENGTAEKVTPEREIYDGAKLEAGWTTPINSNVIEEIIAVGLPDNAKLVVEDLASEKAAELEGRLPEVLRKYSEKFSSEFTLAEGSTPVGVDIEITGLTEEVIKENKPITLMVAAPEALKADELAEDEHIKAIHFKEQGDPIVLDVELVEETDETGGTVYKLVFDVEPRDLFSPFYFVKVKATEKEPDNPNPPVEPEKVTVKVTGSDDGYIAAWTWDEFGIKYLPVNEDVSLEKGTYLYFMGVAHGDKIWASYTISNKDTGENEVVKLENRGPNQDLIVNNNCEITPAFAPYVPDDDNDDDYVYVWLEPEMVTAEGIYSGVVTMEKWDAAAEDYKPVTGAELRIPTEEDWEKRPWLREESDWDLFDYAAENREVKSKSALKAGWYELPMILTYEGEEELKYLTVRIGASIEFIPGLFSYDGKIVIENELEYELEPYDFRRFSYVNGDNWNKIEALLKAEPINPRMYNYEFAGWQTLDGVKYESGTRLVPNDRDAFDFYAVAIFTKDGKAYFGNKTGGNQDDKPNNNTGGSTSSGGGSRRHVVGGSSSTITSMTGSWTMGENGWKFLKTNGEYATNTWGYINNQWYYFNEAGDMVTGWRFINGRWYYLNPAEGSFQGVMLTGVIFDPFYNAYFYADANGAMVTGWYQVADKWYYFNPISDGRQGALFADTVIDGYYVGADGAWIPGN